MHIKQMQSQLAELSNEYERIQKISAELVAIHQQIESTEAHLRSLKFNIERQIEAFSNFSTVKEDTV